MSDWRKSLRRLFTATALTLGAGGLASAQESDFRAVSPYEVMGSSMHIQLEEDRHIVWADQTFCERFEALCRSNIGMQEWVNFDGGQMERAFAMQQVVMDTVPQVNDADDGDHWKIAELETGGDCEDHVLLKYFTLLKMGFPPAAMMFAYVTDKDGGGHMVLVVSTDEGDMVFDNLAEQPYMAADMKDGIGHTLHAVSFNGRDWMSAVAPERPDDVAQMINAEAGVEVDSAARHKPIVIAPPG